MPGDEELDSKRDIKLIERATVGTYRKRRAVHEKSSAIITPTPAKKKSRMNHRLPILPIERLDGSREEHVMTKAPKRSGYKYCSYAVLLHKAQKMPGPPPKCSNVQRMCAKCGVHLCKHHFDIYHQPTFEDGSTSDGDGDVNPLTSV